MSTLFDTCIREDDPDANLVAAAVAGDAVSLNTLLERYQPWLLNLALCYSRRHEDAEDAVQEILMKVVLGIAKFKRRSLFKSWLRRFAINHLINISAAKDQKGREEHGSMGLLDIADPRAIPTDMPLLIEEARSRLLLGMLLCLDCRQRTAVLVSDFLELDDHAGAIKLGLGDSSYRAMLSHARKELHNFLMGECLLLHADKSCRCVRKAAFYVRCGYVDPQSRKFFKSHVDSLQQFVDADSSGLEQQLRSHCFECSGNSGLPESLTLTQILSTRQTT